VENRWWKIPCSHVLRTISRMEHAQQALAASPVWGRVNVLKTEYPERDLCMVDVPQSRLLQGHALERWANHRGIAREQVMAIGDNLHDVSAGLCGRTRKSWETPRKVRGRN